MSFRCLLIGPNEEGEHATGEDTYVRSLLENPPPGVEYVHYTDLLAGGKASRQKWVHTIFSSLSRCGHLRPAPWLETLTTDEDFDLVHVHGFDVRLKGNITKKPLVLGTSSYGPANCAEYLGWGDEEIKQYHRRLRRFFRRFGIYDACNNVRDASRVLVWSEYARSLHRNGSQEDDKIAVIPPGVEVPECPTNELMEKIGVLFVGRDFSRKGGDVLLKAWKKIPQEKAQLIMVGFHGVALPDYVKYYPYIAPQALNSYFYMKSQILAFPVMGEGYGMVVLEAMAHGLAVVASNIGAIPEIVVDGETGFLVPPGDAGALAARLQQLLEQPKLCREMGLQGRERVLKHFSLERRNELLGEIYKAAVSRSSREMLKECAAT